MSTQPIDWSKYESNSETTPEEQQRRQQSTHQAIDWNKYTSDTASALQHTAPGTDTDLASRGRQLPPSRALVSPQALANTLVGTSTMGSRMPEIQNVDFYGVAKDEADRRFAHGEPKGLPGLFTDVNDFASSQTTPENLALNLTLGGAGALTKAAPAVGLITKPLMAGAGLTFAGMGGKDIYDAATDTEGEPADRLRKGLFGGAQIAGGAAAIGESSPRGALGKGMDIAAPNEPFTPRELLQEARKHGINLDLADATNAPVIKGLKQSTMYGLAGSGPFERAQGHNVEALQQWNEQAGDRIQKALENDYTSRKQAASDIFEDLDKRVGGASITDPRVETLAKEIRDRYKQYYQDHPQFIPKDAWNSINNLADRQQVQVANNPQARGLGWQSKPFSWSELHDLRSDLMESYRNSNDLTKSKSEAWLQRMVKVIDDTMNGAASHLTPADQAQFRQANETWEGLKETYDNPKHPLYTAIRSTTPSELPKYLNSKKAIEFWRMLEPILGPEYSELGQVGRIGDKVMKDYNPPGSGKHVQKYLQATGIGGGITAAVLGHPLPLALSGGNLVGEFASARAINSPRVVDFLTDPHRGPAFPRGLAVAAPAASAQNEKERVIDFLRDRTRVAEMAGQ